MNFSNMYMHDDLSFAKNNHLSHFFQGQSLFFLKVSPSKCRGGEEFFFFVFNCCTRLLIFSKKIASCLRVKVISHMTKSIQPKIGQHFFLKRRVVKKNNSFHVEVNYRIFVFVSVDIQRFARIWFLKKDSLSLKKSFIAKFLS